MRRTQSLSHVSASSLAAPYQYDSPHHRKRHSTCHRPPSTTATVNGSSTDPSPEAAAAGTTYHLMPAQPPTYCSAPSLSPFTSLFPLCLLFLPLQPPLPTLRRSTGFPSSGSPRSGRTCTPGTRPRTAPTAHTTATRPTSGTHWSRGWRRRSRTAIDGRPGAEWGGRVTAV